MQRRDFLKSAAIGCCGTLIGNSLIENAFAKNSINENNLKTVSECIPIQ